MTVSPARFEFALTSAKSDDWAAFERMCSEFLIVDYPNLRTTASTSGDKGRDAELFTGDAAPRTMFQYSVQKDWSSKISGTLKTLGENFPEYSTLVFLTNQQIGAKGDSWKAKARNVGVFLDIRDRSWFLDRFTLDGARSLAAEKFSSIVADILLQAGVETSTSALRGQEARTALTYLEMQAKDDTAAKGLTKSCFDALVKCALRDTSSENKMNRAQIHKSIGDLLPQHLTPQLAPLIDSALQRLSKGPIKITKATDEFHISFEEAKATKDKVAAMNLLIHSFNNDVEEILQLDKDIPTEKYSHLSALVRNVIEVYFYKIGEEFVQSIANQSDIVMNFDVLNSVIQERVVGNASYGTTRLPDLVRRLCTEVLESPSSATTELLRLLSTSYTLFAFLSEVPDVQKATKRLFEHATVWLDTTAVLPILAEQATTEDRRQFSNMYLQLRRAGTKLAVTEGVIEEVLGHLNNSLGCHRKGGAWVGRTPYIYAQYMLSGKPKDKFASWVENFIGNLRPADDIADYLLEHGVEVIQSPDISNLDSELVSSVRQYWHEVHDKRRNDSFNIYANELAENDAENYLVPIAQRKSTRGMTAFGYTSWYLTLDSNAWKLKSSVDDETRKKIGHAPLISLDFLIKYLSFGPRRDVVDTSGLGWSRIFNDGMLVAAPEDVAAIATQVRRDNAGMQERLIQRKIRDELDRQRGVPGAGQRSGLDGIGTAFSL